jgi:hypothetical protein
MPKHPPRRGPTVRSINDLYQAGMVAVRRATRSPSEAPTSSSGSRPRKGAPTSVPSLSDEGDEVQQESDEGECDNPPRKIPYYRLRPIHFGH